MEEKLAKLLEERQEVLGFYSPYSYIKEFKLHEQYYFFVKDRISKFGEKDLYYRFIVTIDNLDFVFLYEFLEWDSNYFQRNCYKLFTILFSKQDAHALVKAIFLFKEMLEKEGKGFCFMEIPSEDIFLIQCLNEAGVRLVESRLHFYKHLLSDIPKERYLIREATADDIPILSQVAKTNRNSFDRLHADFTFSRQEADAYLGVYAEAAVNGFCDKVFVPGEDMVPIASFLAFNYIDRICSSINLGVIRISLAAVAEENKGWLFKLLSETLHYGKQIEASYIEYPTQSTNRAAIRTCEKLNFNLGSTSHILTFTY